MKKRKRKPRDRRFAPWLGTKKIEPEKREEETMLTVTTGKTWTCDCTNALQKAFSTVDERIAVQHMNAHFKRRESYRMVVTKVEDGATVVDEVHGATFTQDGSVRTYTLDDLKKEAEREEATKKERERHYQTFARITIRVHNEQIAAFEKFGPVTVLKTAIEASGFPPVRMFKGETANMSNGPRFPHYSIVIDSPEASKREANRGKGRPVSKSRRALAIAKALSELPDDQLAKLERAVGIARS